jgi:hypothetical protein
MKAPIIPALTAIQEVRLAFSGEEAAAGAAGEKFGAAACVMVDMGAPPVSNSALALAGQSDAAFPFLRVDRRND